MSNIPADVEARMRQELDDLKTKTMKIRAFIGSHDWHALPSEERHRLESQAGYMSGYLRVLMARMAAASSSGSDQPEKVKSEYPFPRFGDRSKSPPAGE